ncbi:MAG: hypothetical protein Q8P89_02300 [bacterium]|nr:hypothetical protein [bacterium]
MNIYFLPKTSEGKWAVKFITAFFLLFVLMQILIASGQQGGETIFDNLFLSIPGVLMFLSGISAFFTGAFGVIRRKERALIVLLTTTLGFFILIFILGEIFFEH